VPRLYRQVRPGARFERSLELLRRAKEAGLLTKSGIMVGLGEEWDEVLETIGRIRDAGTDILTVGQYLRPSLRHLAIERFYTPDEFARIKEHGRSLGFAHVESGPLVRSSYHAEEQVPRSTA
jgi:lipoyl synthase